MNDYSGIAAGLSIGVVLAVVAFYLGTIALGLWIGYLVMRTAVKNGILRADEFRANNQPTAPAGWYDAPGGKRFWDGAKWTTLPTPSKP